MSDKIESSIKKLFQQITTEFGPKMNDSNAKQLELTDKMKLLKSKTLEVIRHECKESFNWFQNNADVKIDDEGIKFAIEYDDIKEESKIQMENFQACAKIYQFGLNEEIALMESDEEKANKKHNNCVTQVIQSYNKMTELDIKNRLRKCFNEVLINSEKTNQKLNKILDYNFSKLNKYL